MATLADEPRELANYLVFPHLPVTPASSVRAPCCGAKTSADAVLDVRHVRTLVGMGSKDTRPTDRDWICTGCRTRLFNSKRNGWTVPRLARATGMPWQEYKLLRAMEIAHAADGVEPEEELARVLATLPDGTDIPGTEIPPDGRKD